ncbi:uncharacterized protein LOC143904389 [Temnothorax americanus]|uniref:uncharacterized protein LOC143904389 n=1 Tax=Temnothorax americanus TaxID=1964332 RepID=UPI004068CA95
MANTHDERDNRDNHTGDGTTNGNGPRYFRDVHEALPKFDPVIGDISIEDWINKIEEFGELYNWDDVAIRHYGLVKLSGVVKKWRDSLPAQNLTWREWKELLVEAFPSDDSVTKKHLEAQNYKRKSGQHMVEYFYEKLSRCNKAQMSDAETIEWLVLGIENMKIREYIGLLSRYDRPSKLLPDLKSAERFCQEPEKRESSDKKGSSQSIRCFKCKEDGHHANKCPQAKVIVCFKCSGKGHYAKDCKGEEQTNKTGASNTATTSKTNTSKTVMQITGTQTHIKYFKDVYINDKYVKSYIDLGSSCVALRDDIAEEEGFTYLEGDFEPLIGYGSGEVKPKGLFTANLTVDGVTARVKIHVVPKEYQTIPLIVGHPYTEASNVVMISKPGELRIGTDESDLLRIEPESTRKTVLWATEATVIPNNFLGHVMVRGDLQGCDVSVEGRIQEDGQLIPRCLISADDEGRSILHVLNMTGKDLKIKEGATITRGDISTPSDETPRRQEVNEEEIKLEEINTDAPEEDIPKLLEVLNQYKDLIARNMRQIGCTKKAEMKIKLHDTTPVHYRPYRMSQAERAQIQRMIDDLREAEIIEESDSPFASHVILVRKKNGDVRMCIDYRGVNKQTVKRPFSMARIDDQVDRVQGMRYFTTLDLSSGYYQVPMSDDSKHITAFSTTDGHYHFKRMPFGLCNAPAEFQRLISKVLSYLGDDAMAYFDDIIIPSKTIEEGLRKLKRVLQALREAGLTLNLSKCCFLKQKIDYLGFEITANGIAPGKKKVEAIQEFPTPTNIREVRSFIGLASYFRRFVKNFALIVRALTKLLKKNRKFEWGTEQQKAFDEIKRKLIQSPILSVYNLSAETEVHTDACSLRLGGVLLQRQEDGKLHPVSFFSRKTTREESNYHSYELEALAIVCTLERF